MRRWAFLLAVLACCAEPKPAPSQEPASAAHAPEPEKAAPAPPPAAEPAPAVAEAEPPLPRKKWDPPVTLDHLPTTPQDERRRIDDLIVVLFDPQAGRDSLRAKQELALIGKPAFLPVLGEMAIVRDTITDNDSMEERLIESSLKLADECLREMDGYLDAHDKAVIRPGTDKKYIEYILRMHYKRWMDGCGSPPLKDLERMPGPFAGVK